jgi:protein phosphatase
MRKAFEQGVFDARLSGEKPVPKRGRELAAAVQMANKAILARARAQPELKQMGTTAVAARFSPDRERVYIAHVGDSRCYRMRGDRLRQLTADHTMGSLGRKGPTAEHLFQAVGIAPTMMIDLIVDKPRVGDVYLLCSDGLSKMVKDQQILDTMYEGVDIGETVNQLIVLANERGGKDNVTAILVKILDGPKPEVRAAAKG